jgi:hypothetical protein
VAMGAGRNSQKKRTVGKAVKPEAGYRGCAVPPRPTPPCISGSFSEAFPEAPFCGFGSTRSAAFFNRSVSQSYLSLRNSAVKRTQRNYSRAKCFGYTRGVLLLRPLCFHACRQIWRSSKHLLYWFVPYENLFGAKVFIPKIRGKMRLVGGVLW